VLLLLSQVVSVEAAANPNPNIAPANSSAYGKTYSQWADAWWQWVLTLRAPNDPNPFTSQNCVKTNNTDKVFFLTGTQGGSATRDCVIPTGTPLFFPLVNIAWAENPALYANPKLTPRYTPTVIADFLRQAYASDKVYLEAWIDGVPVKSLQNSAYYEVITDPKHPFPSYILPGNYAIGTDTTLDWVGVSGGYFLLLHPLTPGNHTIVFTGKVIAESTLAIPKDAGGSFTIGKFANSVTYNIKVVPGHK
jgi:hypothetical protein